MASYPQKVSDNILPLSVSETLTEAFEEWRFTEETIDHEQPIEICELCEQEDLRYHFHIENEWNGNQLWVGSKCILKFDVSVFENGTKLTPEEAKKKLNRIYRQMRLDACIKALERLAASEENEILANALEYFRNHKCLTPKYAFVVLWRLQKHEIDHSPSFFKVSLKKDRHKADLASMDTSRVQLIWPALTTVQRNLARRLGHLPPSA